MRFTVRVLAAVLALALLVSTAPAQTSRGSVSGTVLDPSGAVVPNATVTIVKDDTGISREAVTNSSGLYRFDSLDLGIYTLTIKAGAFATSVTKNVQVAAARNTTIDVKLTVGQAESVVTVEGTAEAVLMKTEEVRGGTFSERTVQALPLQGLDSLNLILTLPGATAATTTAFSNGSNQYSINGARARTNNFMIDGVENNDISVAGPAYQITNQDAVQEVVVQTSNFGADFGRAGGGVINQVTKSGTNTLHGSASHYYLSHVFDAANNQENLNCDPTVQDDCRAKYVENIPAFTIGGPVYIPKIYDGRNKTFFFGAAQWDRFFSGGAQRTITIPTAAGLAVLQGLNPACLAPGTNLNMYLTVLNGLVAPPGVSGVDPGYFNANLALTGAALGTGCGGSNRTGLTAQFGRLTIGESQFATDNNHQIRVDHSPSQKQSMTFRWLYDASESGPFFNNLPGFDRGFNGITLSGAFTHTYTFTPNVVNEFRFNYGRIGFDFPLTDPVTAGTLPSFGIAGGITGFGAATNIPQFRFANNWQYQDTVSWTKGRHQFKFGVDFLRQLAKQRPPFNERGSIGYVSTPGAASGLSNFIDDFGGGSGATVARVFGSASFQGVYYPNLFRQAYYVTDSWRVRENLTLNFGVRYENFGQPANFFDKPAFDYWDSVNFLAPNEVQPDNNNWAPTVGFAWSPKPQSGFLHWLTGDEKMVIRGGYRMTYDNWFNNILSNIAGSSPNTLGGSITSSGAGRGTANWYSAVFPTITPAVPTAQTTQGPLMMPDMRNPYAHHYSLGVQRELPGQIITEVSYVGSAGRKLFLTYDMNPGTGYNCYGPACPNATALLPRFEPSVGIRQVRNNGGNSNYNALQVDVRKGYSSTPLGSFQLSGAYTWSHSIDNASEIFATDSVPSSFSSQNILLGFSPRADRASSDFDIRHRGVITWVWDIRGPRDGFLGQVFGGWGLAGVAQFQTGAPYTVVNGLDRDGDRQAGPDRPQLSNLNAPITSRALVVSPATCASTLQNIDTGACTTADQVYWIAGSFRLGLPDGMTAPRNWMRFPNTQRWDLNVSKTFRIGERFRLIYRAEMINAFNKRNFGVNQFGGNQPPRTVATSPTGQFLNIVEETEAAGRHIRMRLKLEF